MRQRRDCFAMSFATNLHHQAVERFLQLKKASGSPGTGALATDFFAAKFLKLFLWNRSAAGPCTSKPTTWQMSAYTPTAALEQTLQNCRTGPEPDVA